MIFQPDSKKKQVIGALAGDSKPGREETLKTHRAYYRVLMPELLQARA
jgi:hypothetical protein